jgi:dihydrofolate synthase / folylpolyglutamate synthase
MDVRFLGWSDQYNDCFVSPFPEMTYKETLTYLYSRLPMYQKIGAAAYKPDLGNTIALCDLLGNPQDSFRSVHVAGTNGKGSVSHMLASVLQESGLKTGLYTSPHLKDFRERIRVNGVMIPKRSVTRFLDKYRDGFEALGLSFFEMTVGLAFDHFRREKVDLAVVEVGMGGRLDSTNIITPLLSVITNISYDHMQFLGDTLEKIAGEKAGIIKPGIPVIIGETQPETKDVFRRKAAEAGAEILFADAVYRAELSGKKEKVIQNARFRVFREDAILVRSLECPLPGRYQEKNIPTVIASVEKLKEQGVPISETNLRGGIRNVIKNTGLSGRWQILRNSPRVICDTGHNEAGIRYVLEQLRSIPAKKLHIVLGFVNDKEIGKLLAMFPGNAVYYFCKADIPRGLDAELLRQQAAEHGLIGHSFATVKKALNAALKAASPEDVIFVGGSTFVVAEVI